MLFYVAGWLFCLGGWGLALYLLIERGKVRPNIPFTLPFLQGRAKESRQERMARIIHENIENYGGEIPQREVV